MGEARNSVNRQVGLFSFLLLVWLVAFLLSLPVHGETVSPAQRQAIIQKNWAEWNRLPPNTRQEWQQRFLAFLQLPAAERGTVLQHYQHWKTLSPAEKDRTRARVAAWRALTESERARRREALRSPASGH